MAELTFLSSLNDEQAAYAHQILDKAKEMGIPPQLALGIAMNESKFKPNVPDSSAGAIGLMQVIPKIGEKIGYSEKQLRDPKTNIEAGLKLLKQNLDRTNNNWMLSAALYNAGDKNLLNANVEQNGLPEETKSYLKDLKSYGVFNTGPPKAEGEADSAASSVTTPSMLIPPFVSSGASAEEQDPEAVMEQKANAAKPDQKILSDISARSAARGLGAMGGAGVSAAMLAKNAGPSVIQAGAEAMERGRIAAQAREAERVAAAARAAGGAGTAAAGGAGAAGGSGPLSAAGDAAGATGRGSGVFNYGTKFGLNEIEAGRALDMTANEGGVHDLTTQRREALNRINRVAPNQFVENPRFGGLMTPTAGGGGGPRESFRMTPEVPASPEVPGGQPAAMRPMPVAAPISTAPPKPGGLEYVQDLFKGMMNSRLARGAGTVMKYAAPPLALAGAASEGQNFYQQLQKPSDQRDYGDMALSGLGALSGAASLVPFAPIALPAAAIATGIGGYRMKQDYDAAKRAQARLTGSSMR